MKFKGFGITDKGVVRVKNEDSFAIDERTGLFVVADGMGGHNSGEIASQMAVGILKDYIAKVHNGSDAFYGVVNHSFSKEANLLASGIRLANQAIFEAARNDPKLKGMGTTIVSILINGEHIGIAHAGDSRLYLQRNKKLQQVTTDHSIVAEKLRRGIITPEEAAVSTERNVITRALGQSEYLEIDLMEIEVADGDRLLLCSDGLTTMVSEPEINALLNAYPDPVKGVKSLLEVANDYGGKDNVTAVLIDIFSEKNLFAGVKSLFGKG